MRVGQWLVEEQVLAQTKRTVKLTELALRLKVTPRTLANWRRAALHTPVKIGRPSHSSVAHRNALWAVGRELRQQGYPGWRPIAAALHGRVPVTLIQQYVSRFKVRRRKRQDHRRRHSRVEVRVLKKNAMWTQDGTHVGRVEQRSSEAQLIKDRASFRVLGAPVGPPAIGKEVVAELRTLKEMRGLPFVLATDNGSPYVSGELQQFLKQEQVIHLLSLPRTPQHNGAAEIQIRLLKAAAGLGKGVKLLAHSSAGAIVDRTTKSLNGHRRYASLGFKTADKVDEELISVQNRERARFYSLCCTRMEKALQDAPTWRAGRLAQREAVFWTMEEFGLVERKRGGRTYTARPENFS